MAIEQLKDPRTKKPFLEASGVISAVYYNELKNKQSYTNPQKGTVWTPTHSVQIVIDGDKISLGLFEKTDKKTDLRCKDSEENYHNLERGAEVSIVVEEGEPYNGKPQYNARSGDVLILKPAPARVEGASGVAAAPYQKKDMTGVKVGHAINVAINVLGLATAEEIIAAAKQANELTEKLRAEYKEKNPSLSDYDLGAMVGQAVLSASSYVESVETIEEYARQTLDVIAPAVTEYIKAQAEPAKPKAPAVKTPAKKAAPKKAAAPVAEKTSATSSGFDDMGDDIPF
jgi:hypothetical protein